MTRRGFTFVEVMVILVVVGLGLGGALGLVAYGSEVASRSQAEILAMATAISVANDPQPRLDPTIAHNWSHGSYDFGAPSGSATTTGFINGLYVERVETTKPEDIVARNGDGAVGLRSVHVTVTVFETIGGSPITAFTTRFLRRGEP